MYEIGLFHRPVHEQSNKVGVHADQENHHLDTPQVVVVATTAWLSSSIPHNCSLIR